MLKLHFFHKIYSNSCLFYVSFPDVFLMVCIFACCVNFDNNFEPTVYEERRLSFLYFYGPEPSGSRGTRNVPLAQL